MADNRKTINEEDMQELPLEDLEEVSGGRITIAGYGLLAAYILLYKELGKDKDYAIEALKKGWNTDSRFKQIFTDKTDEDLQTAIDFIDRHWN